MFSSAVCAANSLRLITRGPLRAHRLHLREESLTVPVSWFESRDLCLQMVVGMRGDVREILPCQRKLVVCDETGAAENEWWGEGVCKVLIGKHLENVCRITLDRALVVTVVPVNEV